MGLEVGGNGHRAWSIGHRARSQNPGARSSRNGGLRLVEPTLRPGSLRAGSGLGEEQWKDGLDRTAWS